jgi:putative ABC transport system permease protein
MNLRDIALRNLMRRKAKAAFVLAGLVIGVATVVALVSFVDTMTEDINHKLEKYGANILIVPRTENLSLSYGGLSLGGFSFEVEEIRETELKSVEGIRNAANVAAVGPMVLGVVAIHGRNVLMSGVDFDASRILKPWWNVRGAFPDKTGLLLGAEAAGALGLGPGDAVVINGRAMNVSGVLQPTGSQDDQLVFTHLKTAQGLLGKEGRISMAEVAALCKDCPVEDMVVQISEVLPKAKVMAIQQVVKGRMETLHHFRKFSYGISGVVILIGSLVVLVTMMGSVRERTEEIGIFRAIGFRKRHVMQIVLMEAALVSGLAGLVGYAVGFWGTRTAFLFVGEGVHIQVPFVWELAAGAVGLALTVGLAASIYPALLAARMDPNEALRAL